MKLSLAERLRNGGYDGYSYAYPHKTAYRPLKASIPVTEAWQFEEKGSLFLYVHLPFCEMRCGFCNLFTTVQPSTSLLQQTMAAIQLQSSVVADAVEPERVTQAAFGGGTPSYLSVEELENLFGHLGRTWPVHWKNIPVSFELSPGTVTSEKLAFLRSVGIDRVSMGVQSFVREDLLSLKRPQNTSELEHALELITAAQFPVFNIDLIYGNEGQDAQRWQQSLGAALKWIPEELYLYPLYVRPLTNLDRSSKRPAQHRRELYLQARDFLCARGYRQISMRLFRRNDVFRETDYCCQDDGMIGLGPGARSYTRELHYSSEYAVGQPGVRGIIERFNSRNATDHSLVHYGIRLDEFEQRLRYVIKSLLRAEGVSQPGYRNRFGSDPFDDLPALAELLDLGLAENSSSAFTLTTEGMAASDTIGPWLYSEAVTNQMDAYQLS